MQYVSYNSLANTSSALLHLLAVEEWVAYSFCFTCNSGCCTLASTLFICILRKSLSLSSVVIWSCSISGTPKILCYLKIMGLIEKCFSSRPGWEISLPLNFKRSVALHASRGFIFLHKDIAFLWCFFVVQPCLQYLCFSLQRVEEGVTLTNKARWHSAWWYLVWVF